MKTRLGTIAPAQRDALNPISDKQAWLPSILGRLIPSSTRKRLLVIAPLALIASLALGLELFKGRKSGAVFNRNFDERVAAIESLPAYQGLQARLAPLGGELELSWLAGGGSVVTAEAPGSHLGAWRDRRQLCNCFDLIVRLPGMPSQSLGIAYDVTTDEIFVQSGTSPFTHVAASSEPDWTRFYRFAPTAAPSQSIQPVPISPLITECSSLLRLIMVRLP